MTATSNGEQVLLVAHTPSDASISSSMRILGYFTDHGQAHEAAQAAALESPRATVQMYRWIGEYQVEMKVKLRKECETSSL